MLWWAFSGLFLWAGLREIYFGFVPKQGYARPSDISKSYVLIALLIASALAYTPWKTMRLERFLTEKARVLSGSNKATVHCNTLLDTALSSMSLSAGYADPETGKIAFQQPWCSVLMKHLKHPEKMDMKGIFSVQMFAHEAMHVRGERNEAVTECQAIQRHYRAALLLGIEPEVARESGLLYFETKYQDRQRGGHMQTVYYSAECAPGKALDENLEDSTWYQTGPGR